MPLGVQLIGRLWADTTVLGLAAELESARPWRLRRPDLTKHKQVMNR